jgi:hypothetical protein
LGVPAGRVRLVQGDGVSTLDAELAGLTEGKAAGTFLHVDPYRPLEPGRGSEPPCASSRAPRDGRSGACCSTASTPQATEPLCSTPCAKGSRDALVRGGVLARRGPLVDELRPGVLGGGVVVCSVGQEALAARSRVGKGLAYAGALEFEEGNF